MTTDIFDGYAQHYDLFYREKGYAAECDALATLFERYAAAPVRAVLDLGCGTGGHALILASRGLDVAGVDRSRAMLDQCAAKAARAGLALELHSGDLRTASLGRTFDAVISMFAVIGYMTTDADLEAAFATARAHLVPGGLFVFDAWYGPAVLNQRPETRESIHDAGPHERVVRLARPTLVSERHLVEVDYRVIAMAGGAITREVRETHTMRYLFLPELEDLLARTGFRILSAHPALRPEATLTEADWNFCVVAQVAE